MGESGDVYRPNQTAEPLTVERTNALRNSGNSRCTFRQMPSAWAWWLGPLAVASTIDHRSADDAPAEAEDEFRAPRDCSRSIRVVGSMAISSPSARRSPRPNSLLASRDFAGSLQEAARRASAPTKICKSRGFLLKHLWRRREPHRFTSNLGMSSERATLLDMTNQSYSQEAFARLGFPPQEEDGIRHKPCTRRVLCRIPLTDCQFKQSALRRRY